MLQKIKLTKKTIIIAISAILIISTFVWYFAFNSKNNNAVEPVISITEDKFNVKFYPDEITEYLDQVGREDLDPLERYVPVMGSVSSLTVPVSGNKKPKEENNNVDRYTHTVEFFKNKEKDKNLYDVKIPEDGGPLIFLGKTDDDSKCNFQYLKNPEDEELETILELDCTAVFDSREDDKEYEFTFHGFNISRDGTKIILNQTMEEESGLKQILPIIDLKEKKTFNLTLRDIAKDIPKKTREEAIQEINLVNEFIISSNERLDKNEPLLEINDENIKDIKSRVAIHSNTLKYFISPNESKIAISYEYSTVQDNFPIRISEIKNYETGEVLKEFKDQEIYEITPDFNHLVLNSREYGFKIIDLNDKSFEKKYDLAIFDLFAYYAVSNNYMATSFDSKYIIIVQDAGPIIRFDTQTKEEATIGNKFTKFDFIKFIPRSNKYFYVSQNDDSSNSGFDNNRRAFIGEFPYSHNAQPLPLYEKDLIYANDNVQISRVIGFSYYTPSNEKWQFQQNSYTSDYDF